MRQFQRSGVRQGTATQTRTSEDANQSTPMDADRTKDTRTGTADKFATTKQADTSSAPVTLQLQLRNAAFPIQFGRYELLRVLGEGSMGGVYLGKDTQLQRDVAIKIPKFDKSDRAAIQRFQREARAMATLRHANLCPVYDVGELDGVQYFTMAYIEGETLAKHLAAGKALPGREVALLVLKLAQAVDEAHQRGIVHRDLKPANIIIDHKKEPVIMDFGLARLAESTSNLTQTGLMIGTPAYMAPEQVRGELERICPASDVYSLGAMMYEMLTGKLAFEGSIATVVKQTLSCEPERPSQIAPGLASGLEAICLKAMAKDPSQRYASGGLLAIAIREFLKQSRDAVTKTMAPVRETLADASQTPLTSPTGPTPAVTNLASLRRRRRSKRQPRIFWSLAGVGGIVLLLILWVVSQTDRSGEISVQDPPPNSAANRVATDRRPDPPDAAKSPREDLSTPDDIPPVLADGIGVSPLDARPPRPPHRTAAEIIQDFDRNEDGMLQEVEVPFDQRRHIMRADADRNGVVVEEELDVFLILFRFQPPPR